MELPVYTIKSQGDIASILSEDTELKPLELIDSQQPLHLTDLNSITSLNTLSENKTLSESTNLLQLDNKELEYPYYSSVYQIDKIKFNNLIDDFSYVLENEIDNSIIQKNRLKTYNNSYLFIKENWELNEELNNLTDYFTEKCRIKCHFKKCITPLEYWNRNKEKIIEECYEDKLKMRDYIYKNTRLCNNFRISVALTILNIFNAKKWLDISAGWGDRLIAAIIHNVDYYYSTDPNPDLYPEYNKIIDTFVNLRETDDLKISKDKFQILPDGFEDVTLPDFKFDLVFSSPPFYDLEIYSDSKKDSYHKYKNANKWYKNFLLYSVNKAVDALEIGGHLVLYIDTKFACRLINDLKITYCGIIYYYYPDVLKFRPLYVWKK